MATQLPEFGAAVVHSLHTLVSEKINCIPLLSNFALECYIRNIKTNQKVGCNSEWNINQSSTLHLICCART